MRIAATAAQDAPPSQATHACTVLQLNATIAPAQRYRLTVIASELDDVVTSIGGWLTDLALEGWNVTVLTPGGCGAPTLRILGACVRSLDEALDACRSDGALVVASASYASDPRVQQTVTAALAIHNADVLFWGAPRTSDNDRVVAYQPSLAAAAFKYYALATLTDTDIPVSDSEVMIRAVAARATQTAQAPKPQADSPLPTPQEGHRSARQGR